MLAGLSSIVAEESSGCPGKVQFQIFNFQSFTRYFVRSPSSAAHRRGFLKGRGKTGQSVDGGFPFGEARVDVDEPGERLCTWRRRRVCISPPSWIAPKIARRGDDVRNTIASCAYDTVKKFSASGLRMIPHQFAITWRSACEVAQLLVLAR